MSGWEDGQEIVFLVGDYPDEETCPCQLRFLSSRTIDMCLSALRIAEWWQRWHDVEDPEDPKWAQARQFITQAQAELMADCETPLVDAITEGFAQLHEDMLALTAAIPASSSTELETVGTNLGELEDDLAQVWGMLQSIVVITGAVVGEPPIPL